MSRVERKLDQIIERLCGIEKTQAIHGTTIDSLAKRLGETDGRLTAQVQRIEPTIEHVSGVRYFFRIFVVAVAVVSGIGGVAYTALRIAGSFK